MSDTFNLLRETPESVSDMLQQGLINEQQALEYGLHKKIEKDGWLNLEPQHAAWAHQMGILSDQQALDYYDHKKHPIKYRVKDILGRGSVHAARDFLDEGLKTIQALAANYDRQREETLGPRDPFGKSALRGFQVAKVERVAKPQTTSGQVAKTIGQTGLGFVGGMRAVKLAEKLPAFAELSVMAPKLYAFAEASTAGVIADGVFYDPYEERLSNFIADNSEFGKTLVGWLKADPEDGVLEAKMKAAVEGFVVGTAFQGAAELVMGGAKILKGRIWKRNANNPDLVVEDVEKNLGKFMDEDTEPLIDKILRGEGEVNEGLSRFLKEPVEEGVEDAMKAAEKEASGAAKADAFTEMGTPTARQVGKDIVVETSLSEREIQKFADDIAKVYKGEADVDITKGIHQNFGRIETTEGALKLINATARLIEEKGENLAGDVLTDAEAREIASEMGTSMHGFRKLFGDTMDLPFKIRAYRAVMQNYATYVYETLAENADTAVGQAKFLQAFQLLYEMQRLDKGVRSSMGRGLRAYAEIIDTAEKVYPDIGEAELQALLKAEGPNVKKLITKAKQVKSQKARLLYARQAGQLKSLEALLELTQASLVSGPKTQLVNITCNALTFTYESLLHNSAILGYGLWKDKAMLARSLAFWHGARLGAADAVRLPKVFGKKLTPEDLAKAGDPGSWGKLKLHLDKVIKEDPECGTVWKALWTGNPVTDKLEKVDTKHLIPDFNYLPVGSIIRLPFRLLTSADEFFKAITYRSYLYSGAFEEGMAMGLKGDQITEFVEKATHSIAFAQKSNTLGLLPKDASGLHYRALDQARINTFSEPLGVSETSTLFKNVGNVMSTIKPQLGVNNSTFAMHMAMVPSVAGLMFRILAIPFYKIMANITRYTLQNSPLGVMSRRFREDIMSRDPVKKLEAVSRIMFGTGVMALGAMFYHEGRITGHIPKGQRDAANNAGITTYSVKHGDKWTAYDRLDPFGALLAVGANLAVAQELIDGAANDPNNDEIWDEYVSKHLMAFADPLVNKTWAVGAAELINRISDPERYSWDKWVKQRAQAFIPYSSLLKETQGLRDGVTREIIDFEDVFFSRFDSTKQIPKRHPVFGTPLQNEPAFMGLLRTRTASDDPILQEMARVGANVQPLKQKQSILGIPVELDKEMFDELGALQESHAEEIREALTDIITADWYQENTDDMMKAGILTDIVKSYRDLAVSELFERHEDFFMKKLKDKVDLEEAGLAGLKHLTDPKKINLSRQINK